MNPRDEVATKRHEFVSPVYSSKGTCFHLLSAGGFCGEPREAKIHLSDVRELLRCNLNRDVQVVVTIFGDVFALKTKDLDLLIHMLVETRNDWDRLTEKDSAK